MPATTAGAGRPRPGLAHRLAPMSGRSRHEEHRTATPLELFFDLAFVIAFAAASSELDHALAEGHLAIGLIGFAFAVFAVAWAWINFTWFASAYDTDDDVYRITTLIQIAGALVLAAGVQTAFEDGNYVGITFGYVVMRLAMVAQWLRAARNDPQRRQTALRYAAGITIVQALWLARLALPESWSTPMFLLLVIAELLVPILAERAPGGPTTYHPRHIAERYGLFTIIVLGEAIASATIAVRTGLDEGDYLPELLSLSAAGLVIVFALWWLYFDRPAHGLLTTLRLSILWGYGHYFILASAAAVGAGLGVVVDYDTHHAEISGTVAGYAVALPVAVYLFFVWRLHIRPHQAGAQVVAYPVVAVLVLLTPLGPAPVHVTAVLLAVLVVITISLGRRVPDRVG